MKYKIGDKVRVREDLKVGKFYGIYFNKEMAKLKGKVVEIKDVIGHLYLIEDFDYYWTAEMFSGLAEEPRNLIELIAKELGVEMGEEFKVSNRHYVYKFTEEGLSGEGYEIYENDLLRINNGRKMGILSNSPYNVGGTFFELISGKEKIIKLPPKPKLTEAERVILENIPEKYKHIKRSKYGLHVYGDDDAGAEFEYLNMFSHLFQFIKQEDKEPYNIEELLNGE